MEREEVFRLKRVKQKKEFEKHLDELRRKGLVDDKGVPIKKAPDDQAPPPPTKLEAKSPGGSKTVVNRPPETVNLLILSSLDVPEPTSDGSTFISPFGGKIIPGITQVEELIDDKHLSVMDSTLLSTTGESVDDRSKEDTIPEDSIMQNKKLNEPARNLLLEMTKGSIDDSEDSKNDVGMDFDSSEFQEHTKKATSSLSMNEGTSQQASEDFNGYSADAEDSNSRITHIHDIMQAVMPSLASINVSNVTDNVREKKRRKGALHIILPRVQSNRSAKTDRFNDNNIKSEDSYISIQKSDTIIHLKDVELVQTGEETEINIKNRNTHDNDFQSTSNVSKNDASIGISKGKQNPPEKILISDIVKSITSRKEDSKTKEGMKDAATLHEYSTSNIATQYEDIEEEQDLKRSTKTVIKLPSKQLTDSSTNTQETVNDEEKEKAEDDWKFVLANDHQRNDVDTTAIVIKGVDELSNSESSSVWKVRVAKEDHSNKPLRIRDSLSETNLRNKNKTTNDSSEENESSKSEEGKKSKKKTKGKKTKTNKDGDLNKTE